MRESPTGADIAGGTDSATTGATPHATANAGIATGTGEAIDPVVETSSPPGQVIQLESVPIGLKPGDMNVTVQGSTAGETGSANAGDALLMEDGTPILTEDEGRILLEDEPASE